MEDKEKKWDIDLIVTYVVTSGFVSCITGAIAHQIGFNIPAAIILTFLIIYAIFACSD